MFFITEIPQNFSGNEKRDRKRSDYFIWAPYYNFIANLCEFLLLYTNTVCAMYSVLGFLLKLTPWSCIDLCLAQNKALRNIENFQRLYPETSPWDLTLRPHPELMKDKRETWTRQIDFLFVTLALCVGLSNIWVSFNFNPLTTRIWKFK